MKTTFCPFLPKAVESSSSIASTSATHPATQADLRNGIVELEPCLFGQTCKVYPKAWRQGEWVLFILDLEGCRKNGPGPTCHWAHSCGQFKKHALLKARTQSPCFSYPRLARTLKSAGLADLSSFGGVGVGWAPDLRCWLPVYEQAKMRPVYLLIVSLTDFPSIFCMK